MKYLLYIPWQIALYFDHLMKFFGELFGEITARLTGYSRAKQELRETIQHGREVQQRNFKIAMEYRRMGDENMYKAFMDIVSDMDLEIAMAEGVLEKYE